MEREGQDNIPSEGLENNDDPRKLEHVIFPLFVPCDLLDTNPKLGAFGEKFVIDQLNHLTKGARLAMEIQQQDYDVIAYGPNENHAKIEVKFRTLTNSPTAVEFDRGRFDYLVLLIRDDPRVRAFVFTQRDLAVLCDRDGRLKVTAFNKRQALRYVMGHLRPYENNWYPILRFGRGED